VIIVDCGTAATVDMLSPSGVFLGGAILPGPALMARALAEGTSRLPAVAALEQASPPPMPRSSDPRHSARLSPSFALYRWRASSWGPSPPRRRCGRGLNERQIRQN
jgi:hypothetical protein